MWTRLQWDALYVYVLRYRHTGSESTEWVCLEDAHMFSICPLTSVLWWNADEHNNWIGFWPRGEKEGVIIMTPYIISPKDHNHNPVNNADLFMNECPLTTRQLVGSWMRPVNGYPVALVQESTIGPSWCFWKRRNNHVLRRYSKEVSQNPIEV